MLLYNITSYYSTSDQKLTTMRLLIKLPKGLSNRHCERFDPAKMGGLPPMRSVPEGDLDTMEKEGKNCVKIAITKHIFKSFELFSEGGPEAVIMLIQSTNLS